MPPIKNKRCCVPHCPNTEGDNGKKQFFRMGANLASRNRLRIGKLVNPNSAILHCCEDHFDLPNDAINYIRYKYQPGTKLKLRSDLIPHKRLPVNVCRLCLNLIYNEDGVVDISEETGPACAEIVTTLLPRIDLSVTVDPVACLKCFNPLKQSYKIKRNALNNEMVVINCLNSVIQKSPKKIVTTYQIDLFDEYNEIKDLLKQNQEEATDYDSEQTEAEDCVEDQLQENFTQIWENENQLENNEDQLEKKEDQLEEKEDQPNKNEDQYHESASNEKNIDLPDASEDYCLTDSEMY